MPSPQPTLRVHSPARTRALACLISWLAVAVTLVGPGIGLARSASLGREYLVVGALKRAVLGALTATSVGGLEQAVLHRLWRRLSLGSAIRGRPCPSV